MPRRQRHAALSGGVTMSPANMAESVKARLQNTARESGKPFAELLQLYVMERFLYRLSQSDYAEKFVLKGALLFLAWETGCQRRTTLDIDLLGFTSNSLETTETLIRELCETAVKDDGVLFDTDSIRLQRITEDADCEGVRVRLVARLGNSRVSVQVDIGLFSADFSAAPEKETQWKAFLRKQDPKTPATFHEVVTQLQDFFLPLMEAILSGKQLRRQWKQGWK
jgi:hypothetical protein